MSMVYLGGNNILTEYDCFRFQISTYLFTQFQRHIFIKYQIIIINNKLHTIIYFTPHILTNITQKFYSAVKVNITIEKIGESFLITCFYWRPKRIEFAKLLIILNSIVLLKKAYLYVSLNEPLSANSFRIPCDNHHTNTCESFSFATCAVVPAEL